MIQADSLPLKTQQAALHQLLNQLPRFESLLIHHVNATIPKRLDRQLDVLPPSAHAAACTYHLEILPSGRRHLKLDISSIAPMHAAAAVLPQMQGLDSLKLRVDLGSMIDWQGFSFVSRITALTDVTLILRNSELIFTPWAHTSSTTTYTLSDGPKVLLFMRQSDVTDSCIFHLIGLTALQHLDLHGSHGVTDRGISHLRGLAKLQHLNLSGLAELEYPNLPEWQVTCDRQRHRPSERAHRVAAPRPELVHICDGRWHRPPERPHCTTASQLAG
jgi:hypothetical protein